MPKSKLRKQEVEEDEDDDVEIVDEEELSLGIRSAYANYSKGRGGKEFKHEKSKKKRGRRIRAADTNVLNISLGTLANDVTMATGDATPCENCGAYFSVISELQDQDSSDPKWVCEFCDVQNNVFLDEEEIPTESTMDYMIEPARTSNQSSSGVKDESLVVFCIDTSGSMCVTTEVEGKHDLKGGKKQDDLEEMARGHGSQRLPGQKKNVTYVSRLQCVQAAVESQLEKLSEEFPDRKVVLVTFSNDVKIVGDGSQTTQYIAGDNLEDKEYMATTGAAYEASSPISESKDSLVKKLYDLSEQGATALGPALVTSVAIASKVPGSSVIVCTDGLANVGVGKMEGVQNAEENDTLGEFYQTVGEEAQAAGVTVNLVSIASDGCNIENLGQVTELTSGTVDIVDPVHLKDNFANIMSEPVIATSCHLTFIVHSGMTIVNQENVDGNKAFLNVGNVTESSDITFEYTIDQATIAKIRELAEASGANAGTSSTTSTTTTTTADPMTEEEASEKKTGGGTSGNTGGAEEVVAKLEEITKLPFQVQIHYERPDGMKCVRVISKTQDVTDNREEAEKDVDISVLGLHAIQHSAKLAQRGEYEDSRELNFGYARLMRRSATSEKQQEQATTWMSHASAFDDVLLGAQNQELQEGMSFSDEEEERYGNRGGRMSTVSSNSNANSRGGGSRKKGKKFLARKMRRNDESAKMMYKNKKFSRKDME